MKQMKFFLLALMTVVMGVSVTSCMKGDENTQVTDRPILGKVKDSFMGLTFTSLDGYTFKSKNMVEGTSGLTSYDFIIASCSYDTEVDIDYTTNTINATVGAVEKISGNEVPSTTKAEDEGDDSMYKSNRSVRSISDNGYYVPSFIDNYNLLIPIQYLAQEKTDKHTFKLVYYTDNTELAGKADLKLYLRHTSTEEKDKEQYGALSYKVFNIMPALTAFKQANSQNNPTNIIIETEVSTTGTDVPTNTTPVTVKYTFKE